MRTRCSRHDVPADMVSAPINSAIHIQRSHNLSPPPHLSALMAPVSKRPQQASISSFFSVHRRIFEKGVNFTKRLSFGRRDVVGRISNACKRETVVAPCSTDFDSLPCEMVWVIFERLDLTDLFNVAQTSKRCLKIVQDFYLSPSFRVKMKNASVADVEKGFNLLLKTVPNRVDYILDFFNHHYATTRCDFNWDSFMFRINSKLMIGERTVLANQFVDRLKNDALRLVKCSYPDFHSFDESIITTSRAFHVLFRSVIGQDSFVSVLERVLHWFNRSRERGCFMVVVFCDSVVDKKSLNNIINKDLSEFSVAQKHFSDISQALQALSLAVARGTSTFSELHVFGIIESATTFPEPWALRNFVAALFLAPEAFRTFCTVRFRLVQYNELVDIIFEALSSFDSWNIKYLNVFFGVLHDFMISNAAGEPKQKFVYILTEVWERFMEVFLERPLFDPTVLSFHSKFQVFMDISLAGV